MEKEVVFTENAPRPLAPYSQAIRVGEFLFVSGQLAIEPSTGEVVKGDVKAQTRRVLENVKSILEGAGSSLEDVVKVNVYLARREDFAAMNEVYREYFKKDPPARTTVVVHMVSEDYLIEIDVIALVRHK